MTLSRLLIFPCMYSKNVKCLKSRIKVKQFQIKNSENKLIQHKKIKWICIICEINWNRAYLFNGSFLTIQTKWFIWHDWLKQSWKKFAHLYMKISRLKMIILASTFCCQNFLWIHCYLLGTYFNPLLEYRLTKSMILF